MGRLQKRLKFGRERAPGTGVKHLGDIFVFLPKFVKLGESRREILRLGRGKQIPEARGGVRLGVAVKRFDFRCESWEGKKAERYEGVVERRSGRDDLVEIRQNQI
jgi:hypothetical protein